MVITLKVILGTLSIIMFIATFIAPSSDRSLEGVFTGQTDKPAKKPLSIKIAWVSFILWLLVAIAIALLKG